MIQPATTARGVLGVLSHRDVRLLTRLLRSRVSWGCRGWVRWIASWTAGLALVGPAYAQGTVEPIAPGWRPADWQQLEIASARASASLDGDYAPARVHDGDPHTKWVCPTRPTSAAPQWIAVSLADGETKVRAVAVLGERIDNDGILDADVQVLTEGRFQTVASIRGATSPSWLATFAPVQTREVRVLVLQSSGPTEHTDVWELEVGGCVLSDDELRGRLETALGVMLRAAEGGRQAVRRLVPEAAALPAVFRKGLEHAENSAQGARRSLEGWNGLDRHGREGAAREARAAATFAERFHARIRMVGSGEPRHQAAAEALRKELHAARTGSPNAVVEGGEQTVIAGDRVVLAVDSSDACWRVAWGENVDVAIAGVGFGVVVDGDDIASGRPQTTVREGGDQLGAYREIHGIWEKRGLRVERELRVYPGRDAVVIGGRITNSSDRDVRLGTTRVLELATNGWWSVGAAWELPAAVYIQGHSLLRTRPFESPGAVEGPTVRRYASSGVLALVSREPDAALVIGCVRADEAAPDLAAEFEQNKGGTRLTATSRFLERRLGPKETLELNPVYLAAGRGPVALLESYGDAVVTRLARPVRTGATGLWCSWYAHRMGMTEERVLANAEVAAQHFRPLGLEIMQLDHGWQRGDVTGDWVPNERFPHGLGWLAEQLRTRFGLRLGIWIAPTDVAATSELFRQHPDWMLRGADGKPRVNWRWYWKPNPDCYELDATQPEASRWIADTFRRLTGEGVSYYKIDFIAAAGGEHFQSQDPRATRGWSNLRRAMEAIRSGAGDAAWIRYCQTPPILSAGLASSAYGGDDTLDAGVPGRFDLLKDNAHALAAGWWLNDRLYHREVCDMSVRMQGSVEEVRVRAAIMTLANCSISWSDELCYLPPSRLRLMQQCLPPGNPPMRPLDLFERDVPSLWHLRATNQLEAWDVVGVFNFNRQTESRTVDFARLGLDPATDYAVFEFWEERFLGVRQGAIEIALPPESSRILSIRRVQGVPQLVGTDMHLLQGWHEVSRSAWDPDQAALVAVYRRAPGLRGRAFILVPQGYSPKFDFPLSPASARLTHVEGPLWMQELEFERAGCSTVVPFEAPKRAQVVEPTGP